MEISEFLDMSERGGKGRVKRYEECRRGGETAGIRTLFDIVGDSDTIRIRGISESDYFVCSRR